MEIIYTMIVWFSVADGSLAGETLIQITGFETMTECELVLDTVVSGLDTEYIVEGEAICVEETGA